MNGLALLQLLTACVVSEAATRAFWQFGNMILCAQPNVNPLAYNNYGCFCGFGGSGKPVDDLDKCCQTHDDCYGDVSNMEGCTSFFGTLYIRIYNYTCRTKEVKCTDANNKCQAALCECDRAAAHCFAKSEFNPNHKDLDSKVCQ